MYVNQLTTRELFSNNLSDRHEYADGNECFSQLPSSQYNEMMTQNSQEAFNSQQMSSGSEVQSSQGRRRFLDNYMSENCSHQPRGHGSIHQQKPIKNDHISSAVSAKSNFQQQLQLNKAKAKERDERDLLNVMVKTVKECSEDIKHTMNDMKDTLGRSVNTTDDKLSEVMSSISQNIHKNCEKMIEAVQERDQNRHQQNSLKHEIKQKNERIQELEQQVKEAHEMGFRNVVQSVKEVVDQHHSVTKEKLERLADITTELLDHQKEIIHQQREGLDQQHQLNLEVQDAVRAQTGTDNKSVLDELLILRQELDRHKYELENFCRENVYSSQRRTEDLKKFIRSGLDDNVQDNIEQSKHLFNSHCQKMKEDIIAQQDNLKGFIYQKFKENNASTNPGLETSRIGESRQRFSDYHESVPKKIQDQLDEMHSNHIKEVERIRREINQRNEESQKKKDCLMPPGSTSMLHSQFLESREMENGDQERDSFTFKRGKNNLFISPGKITQTSWTAKQLFSRSNPSPVATVYPQQKDRGTTHKMYENDRPSFDEQKQAVKMKPRGSAQPQRRSQRLLETKETSVEEKVQNSFNSGELRKSQRISVMQTGSKEDDKQPRRDNYTKNSVMYQEKKQNNSPRILQEESWKRETAPDEPRPDMRHSQRQTIGQECNKELLNKPVVWQRKTEKCYTSKNTEKYSRTPRQSSFKVPDTKSSNMQRGSQQCGLSKTASVYDFRDEQSFVGSRPSNQPSRSLNFISSRELPGQHNEYSQDMSSSRESSPSLSVTKIVIQRKVKRDKTQRYQTLEAAAKNMDKSQGQYKEYDDDFLSIVGSINDQAKKSVYQRGSKRPMADYSFGTAYAQVTESIHKKRKNIF
ncbi:protein MLP1-like [Pecten maximus]|uniref:protein MLP1-like n=1 Tax=Pecten maximus TaxID=6579 RepID=UPI0014591B13|nr:protein MLP1-like [Pecten maximus]